MDLFKAFEPCLINCGYNLFDECFRCDVHPLQIDCKDESFTVHSHLKILNLSRTT